MEGQVKKPFSMKRVALAAVDGGVPGGLAMILSVVMLMWLRTVVQYQYTTGVSTLVAFQNLYAEGGLRRFYSGVGYALLQAPLARFGDTAANEGVQEIFAASSVPPTVVTLVAAVAAGCWRILISPLDMFKTTMQVRGSSGVSELRDKVASHGAFILFTGSLGASVTSIVGYYPWYATFNVLNTRLRPESGRWKHARNGAIGLAASIATDSLTNSFRVVKVVTQTSAVPLGYLGAVHKVVRETGITGLLFRGLPLKLMANGIQCVLFTIVWRHLMEVFNCAATRPAKPGLPLPTTSATSRARPCTTTAELLRGLTVYFVFLILWVMLHRDVPEIID